MKVESNRFAAALDKAASPELAEIVSSGREFIAASDEVERIGDEFHKTLYALRKVAADRNTSDGAFRKFVIQKLDEVLS